MQNLPVNISVQQIMKHVAIHFDTVFAVSTLSGLGASTVVVTLRFMCQK